MSKATLRRAGLVSKAVKKVSHQIVQGQNQATSPNLERVAREHLDDRRPKHWYNGHERATNVVNLTMRG